jgi:hypothetical protein
VGVDISRAKLDESRGPKRLYHMEVYILSLCNVILNFIYEPLNNALNDYSQKLPPIIENVSAVVSATIAEEGLRREEKESVQQISVSIAKGILEYIGRGNNRHTLLNSQNEILESISQKVGFGQADANILNHFKKYTKTPSEFASKVSYTQIKDVVEKDKSVKVINNAATKAIEGLGLNDRIVCPNSSIVDAMGIFGSCAGTNNPREKYSMGFTLTDTDNIHFYTGQSVFKSDKLKIIYSARINEFVLPYVQLELDIKNTKHVTTLSANNTFKSVINKILDIWMRIGDSQPHNVYWNVLHETKDFFRELVSVGSLKSVGDLFQEINSTAFNGSYIADAKESDVLNKTFRVGVMGDRPSGVRCGFILYRALSGTHPRSIAGYFDPSGDNSAVIMRPAYEDKPAKGKTTRK